MVAAVLATTATAVCTEDAADDLVIQLRPFATTRTPLSESGGVALVSAQVACTIDSFESRIHCTDSRRRTVGAFGREGEGPGEFRGPLWLLRGPDGLVAAFDLGLARLTFLSRTEPWSRQLACRLMLSGPTFWLAGYWATAWR